MKPDRASIRRNEESGYSLEGRLNFKTVASICESSDFLNATDSVVQIDLQSVESADSAGIAMLLEWTQLAEQRRKSIRWINMPEQMQRLVRINGLSQILQTPTEA